MLITVSCIIQSTATYNIFSVNLHHIHVNSTHSLVIFRQTQFLMFAVLRSSSIFLHYNLVKLHQARFGHLYSIILAILKPKQIRLVGGWMISKISQKCKSKTKSKVEVKSHQLTFQFDMTSIELIVQTQHVDAGNHLKDDQIS